MTRQQVLTPVEEGSLLGTAHADPNSIMCYQIPGTITKSGQPIIGGVDIDPSDYAFMATIYPKLTRGSDHALVWSARSMGANRLRMMWDVVIPSALPELLNGIRTALALAFILLVSSELIVSQQGFGYLIGFLGSTGSYEGMYAVVLTVAFLGFAADRIYQLFIQWLLAWRE